MTDSARLRHRQGAVRVVDGIPYPDRRTTVSLLPSSATGLWLARQASVVHGRLLDLGCGNQPFRVWYEPMVKEVVAADAAPIPGVVQIDLSAPLPFEDASFDTIMCTQVLEHVENVENATAEIARVLRPGGHALITVPFLYPLHEAPYDYWRFSHYGLRSLLTRHGLEVVSLDARGGPGLLVVHYAVRAVGAALQKLSRLLGPLGWLVDNPLVRALVWAPQEALRSRVSTRLTRLSRLASLGYLAVARRPD